jgi:anti-sigma factor RsiW
MLYVDSEGDPELHLRISQHLGVCPECAEWFARQQRFEQALTEGLASGDATPGLWERVLARAGVHRKAPTVRGTWVLLAGTLAVAASLVLGVILRLGNAGPGPLQLGPGDDHSSTDLARVTAAWHEEVLSGAVTPDRKGFATDREVEDYLRAKVPFKVHCPPRKNVNFDLQGAGVCRFRDRPAAYIVGQVGPTPISVFVLDRASLSAFPHERDHLDKGGGRHRCREGAYQMISGVTPDNIVVVVGKAPVQVLERLLDAYGSYHEES